MQKKEKKRKEKKLGKTLEDMGTRGKFLNRTPIAYALRLRIGKLDLIKLQSFCKAKNTIKKHTRAARAPKNTSAGQRGEVGVLR